LNETVNNHFILSSTGCILTVDSMVVTTSSLIPVEKVVVNGLI
jgi:hypothetical protein